MLQYFDITIDNIDMIIDIVYIIEIIQIIIYIIDMSIDIIHIIDMFLVY